MDIARNDRRLSFVTRSRAERSRTTDHRILYATSRLKSRSSSKSEREIVISVQAVFAMASVDRSDRSKIDISPKHDPGLSTARASSPETGIVREIRTSPSAMRKRRFPGSPSLKTYWPMVNFCSRQTSVTRANSPSSRSWKMAACFSSLTSTEAKVRKHAAIFQDLDDGELARVTEVCREQKFTIGQYVFKEGEPGNRLFLIAEGEVRISRTIPGSGEEALAVLKPGSCFGEMSIFDRSERSTDAIANTACTLITISRSDFELLLDFNRDVAYKILWSVVRLLSARLRVTNDNLRSFLAMSMF